MRLLRYIAQHFSANYGVQFAIECDGKQPPWRKEWSISGTCESFSYHTTVQQFVVPMTPCGSQLLYFLTEAVTATASCALILLYLVRVRNSRMYTFAGNPVEPTWQTSSLINYPAAQAKIFVVLACCKHNATCSGPGSHLLQLTRASYAMITDHPLSTPTLSTYPVCERPASCWSRIPVAWYVQKFVNRVTGKLSKPPSSICVVEAAMVPLTR